MYIEQLIWFCLEKKISVSQRSTDYWFSIAILADLLRRQMFSFCASQPSQLLCPTLFRVILVVVFPPGAMLLFA